MRDFYFTITKPKNGTTTGKRYESIDMDYNRDRVMFVDDFGKFNYIDLYLCVFDGFVDYAEPQLTNVEPNKETSNENEEEKRKELLKLIRSEITKRQNEFIKEYNIRKE